MAKRSTATIETSETTTARPRRRVVHRRREEILDAAARVFQEKGYEATSTRDIAEAVGLLKGSLYYYIDSKEDFLYEIIKENHDGALAALESVNSVEGDALVKLAALVDVHVDYFTRNFTRSAIFFKEFRSLSAERQREITAEGDAYLDVVRQLLRDGQRSGVVDPNVDVRTASIGIVGMLNSLVQWYRADGLHSPRKIAREFAGMVITGLASEKAAAQAGGLEALRSMVLRGEFVPAEAVEAAARPAPKRRATRPADA
jgi:AcrR family transcriptional regulator